MFLRTLTVHLYNFLAENFRKKETLLGHYFTTVALVKVDKLQTYQLGFFLIAHMLAWAVDYTRMLFIFVDITKCPKLGRNTACSILLKRHNFHSSIYNIFISDGNSLFNSILVAWYYCMVNVRTILYTCSMHMKNACSWDG